MKKNLEPTNPLVHMTLFPSFLDHSVNENKSNEERIVISFNIRLSMKS